ncbi:MAG: hypothetical protein ACYC6C_08520 [Coriobacteriia bacterium]
MSRTAARSSFLRIILALTVLAFALALAGCDKEQGDSGSSGSTSNADEAAEQSAEPEGPTYTAWEVYINDDDSFTQGAITYDIALNLTAINASPDIAGTYSGTATASTGTNGTVGGQQLSAQAIAQSGQLTFTLADATAGGALATLTTGTGEYTGSGTITMQASGSGSIGGAGGGFANTSSQPITVNVIGSAVTLTVPINGHTYTFTGTISGK